MSERYRISYATNPSKEDISILSNGLIENARQKRGFAPTQGFAFFIYDDNNKIIGGANGYTYYGCVYVDQLWVDETLRGMGYGTQLMQMAEELGKDRNCTFAAVNTMDWEGLDFYKKLGYEVEFERRGFVQSSIFYFLRKNL